MSMAVERLTAEINADPSRAIAALRALDLELNKVSRNRTATVGVKTDTSGVRRAQKDIDEAAKDRTAHFDVTADTSEVRRAKDDIDATADAARNGGGGMDSLSAAADRGGRSFGNFRVAIMGLKLGVLYGSLQGVAGALQMVGAAGAGAVAGLTPLVGILGAIPVGLGAITGAAGATILGLSGVGTAVKAMQTVTGQGASAVRGLTGASRGLEDASRSLVRARKELADAERKLGQAQKQSAQDVKDAREQAAADLAQARKDMARQAAEDSRSLADASRALADARTYASESLNEVRKRSAQQAKDDAAALKDAYAYVKEARETAASDLAAARVAEVEEAKRRKEELVDASFAVEQSIYNEARAIRNLEKAQENLERVQSNVAQSSVTLTKQTDAFSGKIVEVASITADATDAADSEADAKWAVREAEQALIQVKRDAEQAEKRLTTAREESKTKSTIVADTQKANAERVEEAEKALAATRDLVSTREDDIARQRKANARTIADAEQRLADVRETISTREDLVAATKARNAERIADAEKRGAENIVAARERVANAQETVRRRVEDLAAAQKRLTQMQNGGTAATNNLAAAMAKLTPEGVSFVNFIVDEMLPAIGRMKRAAQSGLLPGVERGLRSLLTVWPDLTNYVGLFAKATGDAFGNLLAHITSPVVWDRAKKTMQNYFEVFAGSTDQNGKRLRGLTDALIPINDILIGIVNAASPMVKLLTDDMVRGLETLADKINSKRGFASLTKMFNRTYRFIGLWLDVLRPLGGVLADVVEAARPLAVWMLKSMADYFEDLHKKTDKFSKDGSLKKWFTDQKPVIKETTGLILDIFGALNPKRRGKESPFFQFVHSLRENAIPAFEDLIDTMSTSNLGDSAGKMVGGFIRLIDIFAQSGTLDIFAAALGGIADALEALDKATGGKSTKALGALLAGFVGFKIANKALGGLSPFGGGGRGGPLGGGMGKGGIGGAPCVPICPDGPGGTGKKGGGAAGKRGGVPKGSSGTNGPYVMGGGGGDSDGDDGKKKRGGRGGGRRGGLFGRGGGGGGSRAPLFFGGGGGGDGRRGGGGGGRRTGGGRGRLFSRGGRAYVPSTPAGAMAGSVGASARSMGGRGGRRRGGRLGGGGRGRLFSRGGGGGRAYVPRTPAGAMAGSIGDSARAMGGRGGRRRGGGGFFGGGGAPLLFGGGGGGRDGGRSGRRSGGGGRRSGGGGGRSGGGGRGRLLSRGGGGGRAYVPRTPAGAMAGSVGASARAMGGRGGRLGGIGRAAGGGVGKAAGGIGKAAGGIGKTLGMLGKAAMFLLGGPWMIAIGVIVGGLMLLYKKNETFRKFIDKTWTAIKKAFKSVTDWFSKTGVSNFRKNFDKIKEKIKGVTDWFSTTGTPNFKKNLGIIKDAGKSFWNKGIKEPFDKTKDKVSKTGDWFKNTGAPNFKKNLRKIGDAGKWVWNKGIKEPFTKAKDKIKAVGDWLKGDGWDSFKKSLGNLKDRGVWVWEKGISEPFTKIKTKIKGVFKWIKESGWDSFKKSMGRIKDKGVWLWQKGIRDPFNNSKAKISSVFKWIRERAWDSFRKTTDKIKGKGVWLWERGIRDPFNKIKEKIGGVFTWFRNKSWPRVRQVFTWLGNKAQDVWKYKIKGAFDKIKGGLSAVRKAFRYAKDGIGKTWSKITDKIRNPLKRAMTFLDTKFISKVKKLLRKVSLSGLASAIPYMTPGGKGFDTGGYTGKGSKREPAGVVHKDEFVLKKEATNKLRNKVGLSGLNYMNRTGTFPMKAVNPGPVPGYAIGGKVRGLNRDFLSKLGQWNAALGNRYSVHSGYRSIDKQRRLWEASDKSGRMVARPGASNHNFGLAADLSPGTTAYARDSALRYGLKFPMSYEPWHIEPINARKGKRGGIMSFLSGLAAKVFDGGKKVLSGLLDKFGGAKGPGSFWGKFALGPIRKAVPAIFKKFKAGADKYTEGSTGSGGINFTSVKHGSNIAMGKQLARDAGWTGGEWTSLRSLWNKESNWNHRAKNPSSGAYGIPQSLPGTKMASHGSDWRTNPITQIKWGLDYIKERYGRPSAAWAHSQRTNWYGDGGLVRDTPKVAIAPSFDNGGIAAPGLNLIDNRTGKPEHLFRAQPFNNDPTSRMAPLGVDRTRPSLSAAELEKIVERLNEKVKPNVQQNNTFNEKADASRLAKELSWSLR